MRPFTILASLLLALTALTALTAHADPADFVTGQGKAPEPNPTVSAESQAKAAAKARATAIGVAGAHAEGGSATASTGDLTASNSVTVEREHQVQVRLGGAASYSAIASSPCLKPKVGIGARNINILGAFSKSELLVPDEDCWKRKDRGLDLLERQIAIEERRLGINLEVENKLVECRTALARTETGLERCTERVTGAKQ